MFFPLLFALALGSSFEVRELVPSGGAAASGFTRLPESSTGVIFANHLEPDVAAKNQILLNGSGVAAGDIDGDGLCDLFFSSLSGTNRLYRNLGGWRFEDISGAAGLVPTGFASTGAAFADLEGDGDLDLLVNLIGGGTRFYINDGGGHFQMCGNCGFSTSGGSMSLAIADVDGDGDLDVYVVNYRAETIRSTGFPTLNVNGRRTIPSDYSDRLEFAAGGLVIEHGEPDILYLNDGKAHFSPAPWTDGRFRDESGDALKRAPRDWGLAAMFYDINRDGAPDLYVCNDFQTPDRLWLNDGRGNFRAADGTVFRSCPTFSMSVDFADLDRDGEIDFLTVDMLNSTPHRRLCQMLGSEESTIGLNLDRVQVEKNTLHHGRSDGTFEEIGFWAGLSATDWSWNVVFLDVDLDGYEDLLLTRGNLVDTQDRDANERIARGGPYSRQMIPRKLLMYPPLNSSKAAFRNVGNLTFADTSKSWGFADEGVCHGMCLADLDNDGDLDVIVNNLNASAGLYRNESVAPRIAFRLRGSGANTQGIGAKIEIKGGTASRQSQQMILGGRYLSSDDAIRSFAATSSSGMQSEITWRSGRKTVLSDLQSNRLYTLAENAASVPVSPQPTLRKTWFEDASSLVAHTHQENAFDDFARQGLLPKKFSQLGPGITWADLNGDGRDDLIIPAGRLGKLAIYLNEGVFRALTNDPGRQAFRNQTAVLPTFDEKNGISLLAGLSHYEGRSRGGPSVQQFAINPLSSITAFEGIDSSVGPLALADIDANGSLDLFVGGRIIPGRYPEPATSRIYRFSGGSLRLDQTNTATLEKVGLVSGAIWADLNNDGFPELILACEWGPVKIFANDRGRLRDATAVWGMDSKVGWWNGVATGDFDGDGRLDLFVTNWGLNSKYQVKNGHGPRLYYAAWGGAGEIEPIEAVFDEQIEKWVPERDLNTLGRSIPWVREKFQTHRAYAEAGIDSILGDRLKEARILEANWLETTVFLNRGDHFETGKLPIEAQFTPAFGVSVADFDGDGSEDVFLSQNFFAVQPQGVRNDAGRGLLLRGDGHGNFTKIDGSESGIKIYGEQRGSAVADYDGDGRCDLAVTQNGAPTVLLHNVIAKPGLRLRLNGPQGNPRGVGAIVRVSSANQWGYARLVTGGTGYWSQDSTTLVFAEPTLPARVQVLWPGGEFQEFSLSVAAWETVLDKGTGKARPAP